MLAVSKKLMPASRAASMMAWLAASSLSLPKFIVPRTRRLTWSPVRPSCVYFMGPSKRVRVCSRQGPRSTAQPAGRVETEGLRGHGGAQRGFEFAQPVAAQRVGPTRPQLVEDGRRPGECVEAVRGEPDQ